MSHLESLQRLAAAISARRMELGLTVTAVTAAGGPSASTMARLERPTADTVPPRPHTLRRLDRSLRWEPGSAAGVLVGGDPVPAPSPTTSATPTSGTGWQGDAGVLMAATRLPVDTSLIERVVTAGAAVQARLDAGQIADGGDYLAPLLAASRDLAATYATALIERQRRGGRLPGHVEQAIAMDCWATRS